MAGKLNLIFSNVSLQKYDSMLVVLEKLLKLQPNKSYYRWSAYEKNIPAEQQAT